MSQKSQKPFKFFSQSVIQAWFDSSKDLLTTKSAVLYLLEGPNFERTNEIGKKLVNNAEIKQRGASSTATDLN